jgi:hypothetical protein
MAFGLEYRPPTGEPQITQISQMAFGLNAGFDSEEPLILASPERYAEASEHR